MSPFIIFAIVLTLAYVLYYAANIIIDLQAKPKNDGEQSMNISVGEPHGDEEPASKAVVENPETGTFEFRDSSSKVEEAPMKAAPEPIQEAEQEKSDAESSGEERPNQTDEQPDQTEEAPETESSEKAPEEPALEEPAEQPEEVNDDPNITTVDFTDEPPVEEASDELFDESKAFNPDLAQVQYGITAIVGLKKDSAVEKIIESTNEKLLPCSFSVGNLMSETELMEEVKNPETNIEHQNEYVNM